MLRRLQGPMSMEYLTSRLTGRPQARQADVICTGVEDGLLVYDCVEHTLHHLGYLGAAIWRRADGQHSPEEIARLVERDLGERIDASQVVAALRELAGAGLLTEPGRERNTSPVSSRRSLLRNASAAAGVAIIASVGVQGAVAAQSISQGYWTGYWTWVWNGRAWEARWTWVWRWTSGGVVVSSAGSGEPPNGGEAPPDAPDPGVPPTDPPAD